MMHGRNNGKKLMAVRIVKHAFEIIHLLTGEVSNEKEFVLLILVTVLIIVDIFRTRYKFWYLLLSILAPEKILPVLVVLVLFVVKLSMCHLYVVLIRCVSLMYLEILDVRSFHEILKHTKLKSKLLFSLFRRILVPPQLMFVVPSSRINSGFYHEFDLFSLNSSSSW